MGCCTIRRGTKQNQFSVSLEYNFFNCFGDYRSRTYHTSYGDLTHVTGKGIDKKTAAYFEAGFCAKGLMADWIAIPIHSAQGWLLDYCGRTIDEERARNKGKYKQTTGFAK